MTASSPRRQFRLWLAVRDGLPSAPRYRRYLIAVAPSLAIIWLLTLLYLAFSPVSYTSRMTLILPGTGVGGSINLDTIGQASTTTSSAFSGSSLSPTENYKRLLMADVTLRRAAGLAREPEESFPDATVKLTDQTNLIEVSLPGRTPAQAQRRLQALRQSFLTGLVELRRDEAEKRETTDRSQIERLERKVQEAQGKVLAFQGSTGLVSLEQFNNRVGALDALRGREREARTTLQQESATARRLAAGLKVSIADARRAMLLKADPLFQSLLTRYAASSTDAADKGALLGPNHGAMVEFDARDKSLREAIVSRGHTLTGLPPRALLSFADLSVTEGRARLFETMVTGDAQSAGASAAVAEIRTQIADQTRGTSRLVGDAGRLSDLLRDLRVADAVFSSALARLDTNKADPFASYPLVQTLEAPSRPRARTAPSLKLAIAGAIAASLLLLLGFGLTWLRQPIIRKFLPNA